jgi:erythromycin esterase
MSQGSVMTELMGAARGFKSMADLKDVIDRIKHAKIVMLGEASHGTQEFYEWRRLISQKLIANHGFRFIGVEGDWPPTQRVNHIIGAETESGKCFSY